MSPSNYVIQHMKFWEHCIGIDMFLNTIYVKQKYLVQMKFERSAGTFSIEITQSPRGFRKDFNPLD